MNTVQGPRSSVTKLFFAVIYVQHVTNPEQYFRSYVVADAGAKAVADAEANAAADARAVARENLGKKVL